MGQKVIYFSALVLNKDKENMYDNAAAPACKYAFFRGTILMGGNS